MPSIYKCELASIIFRFGYILLHFGASYSYFIAYQLSQNQQLIIVACAL